jgi:hypothetical protein
MNSNKCQHCGCEVRDGDNGQVCPPPPWLDPSTPPLVTCYGCENELEAQGEDARVARLIEAAQRAGRFDLV